jgi:photosystem II stability/assembly factor-like uncharacterized protein
MVRGFAVSLLLPMAIAGGLSLNAAAGEIVFFEDFDDGVANGFEEVGGTWEIVDGRYFQSTEDPPGPYRSWVNAGDFREYAIEVDWNPVSGEESKIIYAHADTSEEYRVDFWLDRCRLCMPAWGQAWDTRNWVVEELPYVYTTTYRVRIEVTIEAVRVWADDRLLHEQPWANEEPLGDGKVGIGTYAATARFDNFSVSEGPPPPQTFFIEDFDDGVANGFVEVGGTWSVVEGDYLQSTSEPPGPYRSWVHAGDFRAYTVEVDFIPLSGQETRIIYAHADTSENYRVDFWPDGSRLTMPAWEEPWDTRAFEVGGLSLAYGQTYHARINVGFEDVTVWLDGILLHEQPWLSGEPLGDGQVGLGNYGGTSKFANVAVSMISAGVSPFFGLGMGVTPQGHIALEWSRALFDKDSVYTVEFRDSLTEGEWVALPPGDQWPISETFWTDTSASPSPTRFYRIRGEEAFSEEVPGWRMPELAVTSLIVEPERANPGDGVEFHATVSNLGTGETETVRIVFSVDGVEIAREAVEPLPPFGSAEFTTRWTAEGPGRHAVVAELDLPEEVFDGSSENNVCRAIARVSGEEPPVPEIEVATQECYTCPFVPGEPGDIPLIFRNPSFAVLHNIPVRFYIDGEQVGNGLVENLEPGQQQEMAVHWEVVTAGEHIVSVQMDLPDEFPEAIAQGVKGWYVTIPDKTTLYDAAAKGKWVSIGPQKLDNGDVGRINDFAFHPTDHDTMYACGFGSDGGVPAAAGVWKTTNGGLNWFPVGDKLPSMMVMCVAVDPQSPINVYAGTPYNGIFKSRDSGTTWDLFAGPTITGNLVSKLIVRSESAPTTPKVVIYAATSGGVLRYTSDDYWAQNSTASEWDKIKMGVVTDLAVHPTDRNTVYASIENDGLYRTKKGVTAIPETTPGTHDWSKIGTGLPPIAGWNGLKIDIYRSNPSYVYAGVRNPKPGYHYGIYRSKNGGDTFDEALEEYATNELPDIYNAFVRVHPSLPNMVYFGGVLLWQWSAYNPPPGKTSWTYVVDLWRCDMKELKFSPSCSGSCSTYYVACDQGMLCCTASTTPSKHYKDSKTYGLSGDTSSVRNNNLRVTEFYDFDVGTGTPPIVTGGTQDTGTALYEGNPEWQSIRGGDGYYSPIAPSNNNILYSQHQSLGSTWRSADSGKTWQKIAENKGLPDQYAGAGFIAVDPNYPNTVLAAGSSGDTTKGGQVYATTDADLGANCTWTGRGPFGTTVKGSVNRVVIQPGTTHWFAGTSQGQIWYTSAKIQGTWNLIDSHPDKASVISMAFSAKDQNVLYVLYSGGDVYRRVQRLEWTSQIGWLGSWMNDNLATNVAPRVICGDAHRSDIAYVGTDHGVFRWDGTKSTYDSWQPYNDGFPLTTVVDLKVGPDKMLYAATKGRGAWVVITGP